MQKRIAFLFIVILFIIALIPAFYSYEDDAFGKDCPFCKSYSQLFAVVNQSCDFGFKLTSTETCPQILFAADPQFPLPASPETRAPPA